MPANVEWLLGLDFGKHHDSTVLSAIRQEVKPLPRKAVPGTPEHDEEPRKLRTHFSLEWMWRPQLGTRYGEIVDTTERVCSNVQFADNYLLLPDATSIGEPIVEMLQSRNLAMVPVATTSGLEPSNMTHRFGYNVPKKDLVDALVVVFQQGLFDYLPNLGYHDRETGRFVDCSKVFAEELDKFVIKKTPTGRPKYEAEDPDKDHDDTIMSCAIPVWYALRGESYERQLERGATRSRRGGQQDEGGWDPLEDWRR